MTIDTDTARQRWLADLRGSLTQDFTTQTARLRELSELTADTGDPGDAHTHSAMLATTRNTLEQIGAALKRIDDGTYGQCEKCETAIPVERLEVLPQARFCVPCQQKHNG
ncbi:TraR/DksA family transcriptional regulator [Rhizomonospora bruguierae]|uniref:TraR/DksA family transcriptional regulator n=1 Tax=Rhizomonospora bruguierae TaxID=1581705 RepID=UPI001BD07BB3|nr:TraR/DksA C4-type zinc finger protein [Micromonospora sp. NBRC 107566]